MSNENPKVTEQSTPSQMTLAADILKALAQPDVQPNHRMMNKIKELAYVG